MENKVVNKQIPIKSIIDIANYFDDYANRYSNIFQKENLKNKNLPFGEKNYEFSNGFSEVKYTIRLKNGKDMTENDYNWFMGMLGDTRALEEVTISLHVSYYTKSGNENYNDKYNKVMASVNFYNAKRELKYSDVNIDVNTTNQESEAHNIYSTITNILEDNPDRFDKTIKNRKIRIQSLCISVGIVLSYILFLILKINASKIPEFINSYMSNKYVLIIGQWFVSILLGNLISYWYMLSLYSPLLPSTKYAGYNTSSNKSIYTYDIDDYLEHSEVHFGRFWDAEKRRNKIEKIYKITSKIVLVQLVISVILVFILK